MNARLIVPLAAVVIVVVTGLWLSRDRSVDPGDEPQRIGGVVQDESGRRVMYWYDPMVPAQRFEQPGKSPFMDMELVPRYADEASSHGVQVSSSVQQNLGLRTAVATNTPFASHIVTVGRIAVDERQLHALSARVTGYVERLFVRAEGDPVSAGQKVAEIYSPELLSAQQEFLALTRSTKLSGVEALADAARSRLRLYGMASREIEELARNGEARSRFGMYAPASGFVAALAVREGEQIAAGATLMSVADLSSVWLIAEVPERDGGLIQPGDRVTARLEGARMKQIAGTVDFVYPTLSDATRTARVRIVLPNEGNDLRPGMFAHVTIGSAAREVLSIPSESVIYTGSRAVVIVKHENGFQPVEVQTGAEQDGRTEILDGLEAGEQVVASGQFLIDSEASLTGVLARLSQDRPAPTTDQHSHPEPSAEAEHAGHHDDAPNDSGVEDSPR